MVKIETRKQDIVWNYIGTIVSMASGFLLLPFLLAFLDDSEVGLWYVFIAIANLTLLFEFGFNPAFARNIVYCLSGARKLTKQGCDSGSIEEGVSWHLLKTIMKSSKLLYGALSVMALLLIASLGTIYIGYVTRGLDGVGHWTAWVIFCAAIFLNLYFYYTLTFLRGFGDIASENRAKTYARLLQLVLSAALLGLGFGLVGAALGYLANSVSLRLFAHRYIKRHEEINQGLVCDNAPVSKSEIKSALGTISFVAWRDGVVQVSCYASTQAMSIMCSLFLSLAATGTYSILLQFGTAVYHFASAYAKSYYPAFQSARMLGDLDRQRNIICKSISAYWVLYIIGALGVILVIFPLLPFVKPGIDLDVPLFLGLLVYLGLWNQHSIFCNFIICMNRIPYVRGYLIAAIMGVVLSAILMSCTGLEAWGLVLGQAAAQIVYNNWKWPRYVAKELGTTYFGLLVDGFAWWKGRLFRFKSFRKNQSID
ncbi:hypothetical protein GS424_013930 [Eggerthella guodeyinii]|uniref:Polysaccharide biosynthesis protein n=1 Tax=Eggerthella guodeyinii TaxID=2690837 RepID=A0A6L7IWM9_9ACTN|nr:O-unit flippase-like protein [Eggerthella guodeyinii]QOS67599.1 hypothetical protein GS424_013930 [Eggerthella guodeyinii]